VVTIDHGFDQELVPVTAYLESAANSAFVGTRRVTLSQDVVDHLQKDNKFSSVYWTETRHAIEQRKITWKDFTRLNGRQGTNSVLQMVEFYNKLFRHNLHEWSVRGKLAAQAAMAQAVAIPTYQDTKVLEFRKIGTKLDRSKKNFKLKDGIGLAKANKEERALEETARKEQAVKRAKKRAKAWAFMEQTEADEGTDAFERCRSAHGAVRDYITTASGAAANQRRASLVASGGGQSKAAFIGGKYQEDLLELMESSEAWKAATDNYLGAEILRNYFVIDLNLERLKSEFEAGIGKEKAKQGQLWKGQGLSEKEEGQAVRVENEEDDTFFGFEVNNANPLDAAMDLDKDELEEFGFGPTPQPQRWLRAKQKHKLTDVAEVHPVLLAMQEEQKRQEEHAKERATVAEQQKAEAEQAALEMSYRRGSAAAMQAVAAHVPVSSTVQIQGARASIGTTFGRKTFALKGGGGLGSSSTDPGTPEVQKKKKKGWKKSFARKKSKSKVIAPIETRIVTTSVQPIGPNYVSATAGDMIQVINVPKTPAPHGAVVVKVRERGQDVEKYLLALAFGKAMEDDDLEDVNVALFSTEA